VYFSSRVLCGWLQNLSFLNQIKAKLTLNYSAVVPVRIEKHTVSSISIARAQPFI